MSIILVVPYMSTGIAGCSVNTEISCGTRKLTWTSRVIKNIYIYIYSPKLSVNVKLMPHNNPMIQTNQEKSANYMLGRPSMYCRVDLLF